jgi:hypothetical protein
MARTKTYTCSRCGKDDLSSWEAFETGWPDRCRYWCKNHIPWRARLRVWWQERRRG